MSFQRRRSGIVYGSATPIEMPHLKIEGVGHDIVKLPTSGRYGFFGKADLRDVDLSHTFFNQCDFSLEDVKLTGADFTRCQFADCDFSGKGLELLSCHFSLDCLTFQGMKGSDFDAYCLVWLAGQIQTPASHNILRSIPEKHRYRIEMHVRSMRHELCVTR